MLGLYHKPRLLTRIMIGKFMQRNFVVNIGLVFAHYAILTTTLPPLKL
jgi:hypothetical protein